MNKLILGGLVMLCTSLSYAGINYMTTIPAGWKLENYIGGSLVVFFSGSECKNGRLTFPSNATNEDKNRFWSLILASKASKSDIFVQYRDDDVCTIVSFATVN